MGQKNESRLRKCVVCRNMMEKKDLIRVVRSADGEVFIDRTGKANGRGAYICKNQNCIQAACKRGALKGALKCEVDSSVYEELKEELNLE